MDNSIVYITTNLINGKKYIGSHTKNNPDYLGSGKWLKSAIKKYGRDNFKRQILWEGNEAYMREMEEYYIDYYGAHVSDLFYNISNKGTGWVSGRLNPEASEKKKGNTYRKGKSSPSISNKLKGRTYSPETIAKMRASAQNRKASPETKAKMSSQRKGRVLTDEWKNNISNSLMGREITWNLNHNNGKQEN
jgi:group I intron endonuclease